MSDSELAVYGYDGAPERPFPPDLEGWAMATTEDAIAVGAAAELAPVLPRWSYVDAAIEGEVYKFFCYSTGASDRDRVAAMRFVGVEGDRNTEAGTLGAFPEPPPFLPPPPDPGLVPPELLPPHTDGHGASGHRKGDSVCESYVSDASDVDANAIANEILLQGTAQGRPAPWTPGGGYHAIVNGTRWYFTMQQGAECAPYQKCVWAWRCVPRGGGGGGGDGGGNPPAGAIKSAFGWIVIGGLAAVGAVAGIIAASRTKHHA